MAAPTSAVGTPTAKQIREPEWAAMLAGATAQITPWTILLLASGIVWTLELS